MMLENTVATYFAALRARNADAWVATFAEGAILHDPVGQPPFKGHAAIRRFAEQVFGLCTSFGLTEETIFLAGKEAAVKWNGHAVGKNGREIAFAGIEVIAMNEAGAIQTARAYWNPIPVLTELQAK